MTVTNAPDAFLETESGPPWAAFVQAIEAELNAHRDRALTAAPDESAFATPAQPPAPWPQARVIEWLSFQTYYEYQAMRFISKWLQTTPETDVMVLLCQQIADEANHFNWLNQHLEALGGSLAQWQPLPEMVAWVETYYGSLPNTIARLAAHNLAGESGACRSFTSILPFLPPPLQKTMQRIMPDEQFHLRLGRNLLKQHCVTAEQQAQARHYALETVALEARAIQAFNRKLAAIAPD